MSESETAGESTGGVPFVVGIGSSAGGLEAMSAFFSHLPADLEVAVVVVAHQSGGAVSHLPELLARHTAMPVAEARDGVALQPAHVYVAPAGKHIGLEGGIVRLLSGVQPTAAALPIDAFFRSLAEALGTRAIAVILSGAGSDGTLGATSVKAAGGVVLAQSLATAEHSGMPGAAIESGVVDRAMAPAEIGAWLSDYCAVRPPDHGQDRRPIATSAINRLFAVIGQRTGHDFSGYKESTVRRRVQRRMALRQLATIDAFVDHLVDDPDEVDRLFGDLLIGVTSYFRDPEVWRAFAAEVVGPLRAASQSGRSFRVWVPGCSTGEEVYTIAILLTEVAAASRVGDGTVAIEIFGTDPNPHAIEVARAATYPAGITADVSPERLGHYFVLTDGRYRVRKEIRDRAIFARHDLLSDPPFSRLDVLSCRNVLIYMSAALQERVMPTLHNALMPGGLLVLGCSESPGRLAGSFSAVRKRERIFRRGRSAVSPRARAVVRPSPTQPRDDKRPDPGSGKRTVAAIAEDLLASRCLPPSIVITGEGEIVHVLGRTGRFLEQPPGRPTQNAFAMARPGLSAALAGAVRDARANRGRVAHSGVLIEPDGDAQRISVVAEPMPDESTAGLVLVTFEESSEPASAVAEEAGPARSSELQQMEREVRQSREQLQQAIEELGSSTEEQQSMNEELQSTNEELETSKEELQSLNEELQTVNAELQHKVDVLSQVRDDMDNLLNSTQIATLFLDRELRIKRFTEPAQELIHLIEADIGRPIQDLAWALKPNVLTEAAAEVFEKLTAREVEVAHDNGRSYLMRVIPYRTAENVIEGVVVTFIDTTDLVAAKELAASRELAVNIVDTVREPLVVLDESLRVISANASFYRVFGADEQRTNGQLLYEIGDGEWNVAALRRQLEDVVNRGRAVEGVAVDRVPPGGESQTVVLSARPLRQASGRTALILLSMTPAS